MQILGNYIKGLEKRVTALEEHNKTSDVGQVCEKNLIFTKEFIPQDSFQREIDAFSKKMEVCIADVYLAIKNSEDQLAINIEESNTLFRIDINHLDNQIKRIEKHVNEIMQISNSEVYDTSHLQCSHNNKQLMREGIYESFTNGDDVSLNTVILQESNKIEDLFRKHNRTEKVIEEVLKQLNSTKRNLASFKDESTKVSDEHSNQLKLHIQRFSTHESKVVKDLESLSDKLSALKKENSAFKLKLIEKEKEAKDMSISVIDELKQNFERTSKLSKDITDHITTFEITVKAIWDSFGLLSDSINSNV